MTCDDVSGKQPVQTAKQRTVFALVVARWLFESLSVNTLVHVVERSEARPLSATMLAYQSSSCLAVCSPRADRSPSEFYVNNTESS
ncbi:hypothetical protein J6590_002222 [Homalodisca vitripennis]|nr:hypothetical protein J6590_002222 [Homalodisca vitripennis]